MTVTYPPGRTALQFTAGNPDQQMRTTAEVVNSMLSGKLNTTVFLTLTANAATTTVMDPRISRQTTAAFSPTSANAAAEVPTLWVAMTAKQMVVHHSSAASTDRTFNVSFVG